MNRILRTPELGARPEQVCSAGLALILLSWLAILAGGCTNQPAMVGEMERALAIEDTATTFTSVLTAAKRLETISQNHEGEWLPLYWAAHAFSQAALFSGDQRYGPYLDTAYVFFDLSWESTPTRSSRIAAEFHVLEANLHSLRARYYRFLSDSSSVQRYLRLQQEALAKAEAADADNPRLLLLKGIGLLTNPESRTEGKRYLEQAKLHFERFPPETSIHPNWGRAWVDIWMNRFDS